VPPTFSRFLVRRLPDEPKGGPPGSCARSDAASWIPLETNPMCVPPAEPRNGDAASGDQEEAMWRSCCASATDLSFLRLDCPFFIVGCGPAVITRFVA
jgi:hypothetical protein